MKRKWWTVPMALVFLCSLLAFPQSKETGAIVGRVMDEDGSPLPGVTVTLTSPRLMGERTAITDSEGQYRFPALPPGLYTVKAELQGFTPTIREKIRVHATIRLTVDITLKMATVEEEVTVIAQTPTVDVKTSETASVTLSDEILRNLPTSQFVTQVVNYAPGVSGNVAYGASSSTGISYQVDGVDVSDPDAGSAWVFLDYNIVEEAKIMGIGLNAEYGAFTGVIFNTITKSGGNELSGHAEFIFQHTKKGFWTAENNKAYIDDFPGLTTPIQGLVDRSAHLGGPIQKDKIWFFLGGQYYRSKNRPTGLEEPHWRDYKQPRAFLKITSQPSSSLNLMGFFEYDAYNGINRATGVTSPTPETGVKQTSPDYVGNFNLTTIFSPTTFLDIKGAFFIGYYYLDPQADNWETTPAVWSAADYRWYDNSSWWFKADRKRYQANASLSHYAEDFIKGDHDFKFGTELEYGWTRNRFGFTGYIEGIGNAAYIYDWFGYLYAYQYEGYDTDTSYVRTEAYAQDSWSISDTFTLNFGIRYSLMRGYVKDISGAVYKASRFSPRAGFAWDIFGDHTTVLKAHYGQYTETMLAAFHDRLNPAEHYSDFVGYYQAGGQWVEWFRISPENLYRLDDSIKHPYMDQFTIGIERELFTDASLGVSFIYRNWKNFLGVWDTKADYVPRTVKDPYTDATYTVYDIVKRGDYAYVIGNISKEKSKWILDDPSRRYVGFDFRFQKRFSNRWQLLLSYIYSRTTGTINTGFADDIGWAGRQYDPNYWINRDGNAYNDPTHYFRLYGTVVLPLDIYFNAYFTWRSGYRWTRRARYRLNQRRWYIYTEKRGSRRYPAIVDLDLRIEKTFRFGEKYRFGLMMDVFNVFNRDTVTSWGTTAGYDWLPHEYEPGSPGPDGHVIYGLVAPRAIRLGVRFFF
ncbi:MAG: carboxypeptidase regulatory-like domain-containing protein [Candidatus Aminicenantales bacterium]